MGYVEQVKKAIVELAERSGSSLPALKKKLALEDSKNRFINAALKSGVEKGIFVKNKGKFKVAIKEKKAPAKKKKVVKKKTVKKATAGKKSPAKKKKTATKKATTKKSPAKKKKTATKKAKKSPAKKKKTVKKTSSKKPKAAKAAAAAK